MAKVTIKMIAEKAGVSRGTVDRVLNNRSYVKADVKERILRIAKEMGYVSQREIHLREREEENKPLRLGVLLPSFGFGPQFHEGVGAGIREAQTELQNANVEILVKMCRTDLPEEAAGLLTELREAGIQGLSVCLPQDPSIEKALREMKEDNIPIVTFNSDLPDSGRILFVGQDILKSGRLAAQMMSRCIRPGEQVLAAVGNMKFDGHRQRFLGFSERMAELGFPSEDLFTVETFNDYRTTLSVIGEALENHPALGGIYMANLSVTACAEAVRASGMEKKIHVICHDINDGIRLLLKEGRVDFTIPQDFVRQGREPLIWLTSYVREKELPDAGMFNDLQILCSENI
ncbi:MAG: LacI family DNA-binding transcriptional regulator [Eubacteriales bacterium]|nr:LacI family DNA-binding transcriptional regulator [Eubacteriales bacterium]